MPSHPLERTEGVAQKGLASMRQSPYRMYLVPLLVWAALLLVVVGAGVVAGHMHGPESAPVVVSK